MIYPIIFVSILLGYLLRVYQEEARKGSSSTTIPSEDRQCYPEEDPQDDPVAFYERLENAGKLEIEAPPAPMTVATVVEEARPSTTDIESAPDSKWPTEWTFDEGS